MGAAPLRHGKHHSLKGKSAMKEKILTQPLLLSRETIRQLDDGKLVHIKGGDCPTGSFPTTDGVAPH